ncbi:hypothetical protein V5799_024990 [Amblyomma americanum]|uniref:Uncharacterized protein n=1 Tax=Amblyomma americanum TaxID=6943 RepID=A0AAQ4EAK0_AMBAM
MDDSRRLFFILCGLAAAAAVTFAAISTALYFAVRRQRLESPSRTSGRPFCCPGEAEEMYRYINTTLNPCTDFFGFACSKVIALKLWKQTSVSAELVQAMITGVMPKGLKMGDAGAFLTAYYSSCVNTVSRQDFFLSTLARALVRRTEMLLKKPYSRNAFVYITAVSLQYNLPSVIDVTFSPIRSELFLKDFTICTANDMSAIAMVAAVNALKAATSATRTVKSEVKFVRWMCEQLEALSWKNATYDNSKELATFDREVWNVGDLEAGLSAVGYTMQNVSAIHVQGVHEIRLIHDLLSAEWQNLTARHMSAYLLWHSVVYGAEEFDTSHGASAQSLFDVCEKSVSRVPLVWNRFMVETLTSLDKDKEARTIFANVKDAVLSDCRASLLFEGEDAVRLEAFFKELKLVTPIEANEKSALFPQPALDFAENLLQSCAYNFEATKRLQWGSFTGNEEYYRHLAFVKSRYCILSATYYGFILPGSPNSQIPNTALLGRLLAEGLWHMVMYGIHWSSKTTENIVRLESCFVENYMSEEDERTVPIAFVTALALSSILNAFSWADWHTEKPAWSLWTLSHAQFFYTFDAYHRCPGESSPENARAFNAPLMYVEDFANAFDCSPDAAMAKAGRCPLRAASQP